MEFPSPPNDIYIYIYPLYRCVVMFIPRKRRLPSHERASSKKPRLTNGDTGREPLRDSSELQRRRENILVTAFLAINLYLHPPTVYATALYWEAGYANCAIKTTNGVDWFVDHIERLLSHPARLAITSARAVSHNQSQQMKHNLLLQFAGSDLHKVANEYFIVLQNRSLLEALVALLRQPSEKRPFALEEHQGLRGELELDDFLYNNVLNYFYEPSFHVIAAYQIYLSQLFYQSDGRDMVDDFAPVLEQIVEPLRMVEAPHAPRCLCPENSNFAEKETTLHEDLRSLLLVLTHSLDRDSIMRGVNGLLEEKASYCCEQQAVRYLRLEKMVVY